MRRQPPEWERALVERLNTVLGAMPVRFADMRPSQLPSRGGVYLISALVDSEEVPYYVGRTKNLKERLYRNHLMGQVVAARLKKYLIETRECQNEADAKQFIRSFCTARWILEDDWRIREAIEGYITAILMPKHGMYEEH